MKTYQTETIVINNNQFTVLYDDDKTQYYKLSDVCRTMGNKVLNHDKNPILTYNFKVKIKGLSVPVSEKFIKIDAFKRFVDQSRINLGQGVRFKYELAGHGFPCRDSKDMIYNGEHVICVYVDGHYQILLNSFCNVFDIDLVDAVNILEKRNGVKFKEICQHDWYSYYVCSVDDCYHLTVRFKRKVSQDFFDKFESTASLDTKLADLEKEKQSVFAECDRQIASYEKTKELYNKTFVDRYNDLLAEINRAKERKNPVVVLPDPVMVKKTTLPVVIQKVITNRFPPVTLAQAVKDAEARTFEESLQENGIDVVNYTIEQYKADLKKLAKIIGMAPKNINRYVCNHFKKEPNGVDLKAIMKTECLHNTVDAAVRVGKLKLLKNFVERAIEKGTVENLPQEEKLTNREIRRRIKENTDIAQANFKIDRQAAWDKLYRIYSAVHGVNLYKLRHAKYRQLRVIDAVQKEGLLMKLYDVSKEMLKDIK